MKSGKKHYSEKEIDGKLLKKDDHIWGHYLCTVGVIGIRWVQHSRVLHQRVHLFMHDVEVAVVSKGERSC